MSTEYNQEDRKDSNYFNPKRELPADRATEDTQIDPESLTPSDSVPDASEGDEASEGVSGEYFDDDEEFFNDQEIFESQDMGILKQEENTVAWEITNLRTDSGKLRNKFGLRNDPPILQITSSDEQYVHFVLTQNFAKQLSKSLDDVYKAYFGIDTSIKDTTFKGKISNITEWVRENKAFAIIVGVVIVTFILSAVVL